MSGLFVDDEPEVVETPITKTIPMPPVKVKIEPSTFTGITVDTEYVPSSGLIRWGQGSNWTCDYYSQILGSSNEPRPLDVHLPPIEQQYRYIHNIPLKVTSPLSFSQSDSDTNVMVVTGAGYTYPFLTPNVGDMFVADVGDGRMGLFTITRVERATILRDSVYNVEWIMVKDAEAFELENLAAKVQVTYNFSMKSLTSGCGPFVTTEEAAALESYEKIHDELIRRYFTDFLSLEHYTLLVPDQCRKVYDHFVVRFMQRMISAVDEPRVRKLRELNVMAAPVMSTPTIWDAILRAEPVALYGSTARTHIVSTTHLRGNPLLQAIGYTGIPQLVYPIEAPTDVDSAYDNENINMPVGIAFREGGPRRPLPGGYQTQEERDLVFFKELPDDADIPLWRIPATIHPVVIDDYYVLSSRFYNDTPGKSKLELLVNQYLEHQEINRDMFNNLLTTVYDWDNLERYYYHPIVIALLKVLMR